MRVILQSVMRSSYTITPMIERLKMNAVPGNEIGTLP
jgi:hypothetical protein